MDEIRCIYCNSNENLTKSDIIPDSITTAKCKNGNVCKIHNNLTNTLHEQKFAMDFSFIRNKLGYTMRNSNLPVPYKMNIWINEKPSYRRKPSLVKTFHNLKHFVLNELSISPNGMVEGFKHAPTKYKKLVNPTIHYLYEINYKTLFFSNSTIRTVAKIGYEWHCKMNNINEKLSRYNGIINFILNNANNKYVEIIDDPVFENNTKHFFSYVEGAHALFEYTDNGKRYVMFSLFGIVWYRIFICKEFSDNVVPQEMHQFLLDKQVKAHKSNAIAIDIFGSREIIHNFILNPNTLKITNIRVEKTRIWEEKLTKLLTELNVTQHEITRLVKLVENDGVFQSPNSKYFVDLIYYQESKKIMAVTILYCMSNLIYNNKITFIENMRTIENQIIDLSKSAETFIINNTGTQEAFNNLITIILNGKKVFDSIPPLV